MAVTGQTIAPKQWLLGLFLFADNKSGNALLVSIEFRETLHSQSERVLQALACNGSD
jgi:hypothetical protein